MGRGWLLRAPASPTAAPDGRRKTTGLYGSLHSEANEGEGAGYTGAGHARAGYCQTRGARQDDARERQWRGEGSMRGRDERGREAVAWLQHARAVGVSTPTPGKGSSTRHGARRSAVQPGDKTGSGAENSARSRHASNGLLPAAQKENERRKRIDTSRLCVTGMSWGAHTRSTAAAQRGDDLAARAGARATVPAST